MTDMLTSLLPELQDEILGHCACGDLKNLARASKQWSEILREKLFVNLRLPASVLTSRSPVDNVISANLNEYTKRLRVVVMKERAVGDNELTCILRLRGLTELSIKGSQSTTDADLATICEQLSALTVLDVGQTGITDSGLVHLAKLKHLRELVLDSCRLLDAGLGVIAELSSLRKLDISYSHDVTVDGVALLKKLCALEELVVKQCGLKNAAIAHIAKISSLRRLDISYQALSDGGLRFLSPLKGLEELVLAQCNITDIGMSNNIKAFLEFHYQADEASL